MEERTIDYVFKLLDIPWWNYVIAVLFGIATWRVWKRPSLGLLAGCSFLLLAETVLIRKPFSGQHFNPELFWSWKQWKIQKNQILTNVIMFVPVGVLTGHLWKWRGMWGAAGLSIVIEVLQLITARGLCEFDDIFHNIVGAGIGTAFVISLNKFKGKEENKW